MATTSTLPPDAAQRAAWLYAARGFSATFWGLALTVLLLTGSITFRPFTTLRVPGYLLSAALLAWAATAFWRSRPLGPAWDRLARQFACAAALQLYFVPLLGWWHAIPHPAYQAANACLLVAGVLWLLLLVHRLGLETARMTNDPILGAEVRISAVVTPLLVVGSVALFLLGAAWVGRHGGGGNAAAILGTAAFWQPPWSLLPAALPFLLPLALAWEARERCLRTLVATGAPSSERS